MLEIGSIVDGKYRILSKVGQGGMSTVYLAINEKANKPWAIKEVRKDGIQNFEVVRQSLIVETDLLKKLKHDNLPSIIDIIDQDDNFLIVMDYIEGITLDKVIKEYGPQKQDDVVNWAIQLCDVLCYLHTRKPPIIYRDMKPSNVMLKYDGSVVLIDFGTARQAAIQRVLGHRDTQHRNSLEGRVRQMPEQIYIAWELLCTICLQDIILPNHLTKCIRLLIGTRLCPAD